MKSSEIGYEFSRGMHLLCVPEVNLCKECVQINLAGHRLVIFPKTLMDGCIPRVPHIKISVKNNSDSGVFIVTTDRIEIHGTKTFIDEQMVLEIKSFVSNHQTTFNDYYHGKISFDDLTLVMNQQ